MTCHPESSPCLLEELCFLQASSRSGADATSHREHPLLHTHVSRWASYGAAVPLVWSHQTSTLTPNFHKLM